jgi:hypothetical protein
MMSRDLDSIVSEYEESLRDGSATLSPNLTIPEQVARFRLRQEHSHAVTEATSVVLGEMDVPAALAGSYLAFALRVDRLRRNYFGRTLLGEVGLQVGLWTGRGLAREALLTICREVFTLDVAAWSR